MTLNSGKQVQADAVKLAFGIRPETNLTKEADLEIGELIGIKVNANYITSDSSIYAVGDVIEVYHLLLCKPTNINHFNHNKIHNYYENFSKKKVDDADV